MLRDKIAKRFPEILPQENDSIFTGYTEAHDEELEIFTGEIDEIRASRYIEEASGDDLDRIGAIFGRPVGRRLGRDDNSYRSYLKAVVQAFSGRGTNFSMKRALSTSFGLEIQTAQSIIDWEFPDIEIREDTDAVEYEVVFYDWPEHRVSTVFTIADIVDPSGVKQSGVRYAVPESDFQGADEAVATDGLQVVAEAESATDEIRDSVVISGKYGTTYGQSYGTSPLNEKPLSSDEETDDVNTFSTRLERWDAAAWDSFSWDGREFGEEVQSQAIVEITAQDEYGATYGEWYG